MKREPRDPNKPRRKFKAASVSSPGRQLLAKQRRRLVAIDPNSNIIEQARQVIHGKYRP